jgi:hypothetical protein
VFTSWILLLLMQTMLVSARRTDLHRRLGMGGSLLAIAMLVAGAVVAIAAAKRGQVPGLPPPLEFLAVPLGGLFNFAVLVALGFLNRRNRASHKRLMVLARLQLWAPQQIASCFQLAYSRSRVCLSPQRRRSALPPCSWRHASSMTS